MSEPLISFLLSLSVAIPAIIGLIRFNKIDENYYPFVFFIWIGLFTEIISYITISFGIESGLVSNFYVLFEFILLFWLFKNWGAFSKVPSVFLIGLIVMCGIWIIENFVTGSLAKISSLFRICYSVVLVLLSVAQVNKIALTEKKKNIARNPVFIICVGFIILYSFKILIEIFWLYAFKNFKENASFRHNIFAIYQYINVFVNLVYALALLWIQKRKTFTKPS